MARRDASARCRGRGAGCHRWAPRTQTPDAVDQRQRLLSITEAGQNLWTGLPDPVALALAVSFDGVDENDLAVTRRVLQDAVRRIENHLSAQDPAGRGR